MRGWGPRFPDNALLAFGEDLNARTVYGDTPLTLRIRARSAAARGRDARRVGGDLAKIRWLLGHGALPSYPAERRQQPVHVAVAACEAGWKPVVELLLGAGADLNAVENNGDPLLTAPVECGDVHTVEWLVARGAGSEVGGRLRLHAAVHASA